MTKRTGKPSKAVSQALERRLLAASGQGLENVTVTDRNFWHDEKEGYDDLSDDRWLRAIERVDKHGDKQVLRNLLKEGRTVSPFVQRMLADLLTRYELRKPRGRPMVPAYDRSAKVAALEMALDDVRDQCAKKVERSVAIHAAAKAHSLSEDLLAAFCDGKLGSARRMAKRR